MANFAEFNIHIFDPYLSVDLILKWIIASVENALHISLSSSSVLHFIPLLVYEIFLLREGFFCLTTL